MRKNYPKLTPKGEEGKPEGEEKGENVPKTGETPEGTHFTEKGPEAKKKIRCKRWPSCKSEGCEYSHPTETVILS